MLAVTTSASAEGWSTVLAGPGCGHPRSVAEAPDGGAFVGGLTNRFGRGGWDAWIARLDPAGEPDWQAAYGTEHFDSLDSLVLRRDGLLGAVVRHGSDAPFDLTLLVLGLDGAIVVQHAVSGFDGGVASPTGGFFLTRRVDRGPADADSCPTATGEPLRDTDLVVAAVDDEGGVRWSRLLAAPCQDSIDSLVATSDGRLALGVINEYQRTFDRTLHEGWLLVLDTDGTPLQALDLPHAFYTRTSGALRVQAGPGGSLAAWGQYGLTGFDTTFWVRSFSASGDAVLGHGRWLESWCTGVWANAGAAPRADAGLVLFGGGRLSHRGELAGDEWSRRYWEGPQIDCDALPQADFRALLTTASGEVLAAGYAALRTPQALLVQRVAVGGGIDAAPCEARSSLESSGRGGPVAGSAHSGVAPEPGPSPSLAPGLLARTPRPDWLPCERSCDPELCDGEGEDEDGDGRADCDDEDCVLMPACSGSDADGDGSADGQDCAPLDPAIRAAAPIRDLRVRRDGAAVRLSWEAAAGAESYDIGVLPLAADGPDAAAAECVVGGRTETAWLDEAARGDAAYLVRSSGPCGPGTWDLAAWDREDGEPTCP